MAKQITLQIRSLKTKKESKSIFWELFVFQKKKKKSAFSGILKQWRERMI